jgi:acetyl esterase/lipase
MIRTRRTICASIVAVSALVAAPTGHAQDSDFAARASHLEEHVRIVPNVTYLTAGNVDLHLDVYAYIKPAQPRPTLIFIHGGGWTGLTKDDRAFQMLPYIDLGMDVVAVEYRLARVALAPAAVEDCRCALRWVIQHAKDYGFDTSRIVVSGPSSGGHLALMSGMLPASAGFDRECPGPDNLKVAAIMNWFGISDVNELLEGPNMRPFAVQWLGSNPDRDALAKRLSPLTYVRPGLPPILSFHGDADPTVPYTQSVRLHKALTDAGVPNEMMTLPGGKHGTAPGGCCTEAQRTAVYLKIREFLTKHHVLDADKVASTAAR